MATNTDPASAPTSAPSPRRKGELIYRQSAWTRITHWVWAVALFFLLLSGLQIFNAHPALYIGQESGFEYENAILEMNAGMLDGERAGITTLFGNRYNTTGVFGLSEQNGQLTTRGFPTWLTIPSIRDLSTGRVVHLAFAWLFVATLVIWLAASLVNRHLWRDVIPRPRDFARIGPDILDHLRLRLAHGREYNVLQKLSYAGVLIVLFPVMVLTGLAMSPGMDAGWPWLLDVFGGRQTARTIHFITMLALVLFFIVHIVMVVAAGPVNELRSMITGWYRTAPGPSGPEDGQ
ncbi:MAG TPA: cytochrome b/b6 domain-containing protein [Devosiaceae bacterium]|nr:cytochrome b/b6 domain-containing protein [Devosiaceae bacterium]